MACILSVRARRAGRSPGVSGPLWAIRKQSSRGTRFELQMRFAISELHPAQQRRRCLFSFQPSASSTRKATWPAFACRHGLQPWPGIAAPLTHTRTVYISLRGRLGRPAPAQARELRCGRCMHMRAGAQGDQRFSGGSKVLSWVGKRGQVNAGLHAHRGTIRGQFGSRKREGKERGIERERRPIDQPEPRRAANG